MKKNLATAMAAAMAFGAVVPAFANTVVAATDVTKETVDIALANGTVVSNVKYDGAYDTKFTATEKDDTVKVGVTILDELADESDNDTDDRRYLIATKVTKENFEELGLKLGTGETTESNPGKYKDFEAFEKAVKNQQVLLEQVKDDINNYLKHTYLDNGVRKSKYKVAKSETQIKTSSDVTNQLVVTLEDQSSEAKNLVYTFKNLKLDETANVKTTPITLNNTTKEGYAELSKKAFELEKQGKNIEVVKQEMSSTVLRLKVYKVSGNTKTHIENVDITGMNDFKAYNFVKVSGNGDFVGHWAEKEIVDGMVKKWVDNSSKFRPDDSITRAEFAKIVCEAYGLTPEVGEKENFSDVNKNDWFYDYVVALNNDGVINGYEDGTFKPNAPITREEAAKILSANGVGLSLGYSTTKLAGETFKTDASGNVVVDNNGNKVHNVSTDLKTMFRDSNKVGVWADESVAELAKAGVINGYDKDNTFKPQNNITRAEMMTMISKAKAKLVEIK